MKTKCTPPLLEQFINMMLMPLPTHVSLVISDAQGRRATCELRRFTEDKDDAPTEQHGVDK